MIICQHCGDTCHGTRCPARHAEICFYRYCAYKSAIIVLSTSSTATFNAWNVRNWLILMVNVCLASRFAVVKAAMAMAIAWARRTLARCDNDTPNRRHLIRVITVDIFVAASAGWRGRPAEGHASAASDHFSLVTGTWYRQNACWKRIRHIECQHRDRKKAAHLAKVDNVPYDWLIYRRRRWVSRPANQRFGWLGMTPQAHAYFCRRYCLTLLWWDAHYQYYVSYRHASTTKSPVINSSSASVSRASRHERKHDRQNHWAILDSFRGSEVSVMPLIVAAILFSSIHRKSNINTSAPATTAVSKNIPLLRFSSRTLS